MHRGLSPYKDAKAIVKVARLLRSIRPDIVHTHTPKAGFIGMIAAGLARVPVRIYTVNGLVFLTRRGWQRTLLSITEGIASRIATRVVCVSASLRTQIADLGICPLSRSTLLGHGGSHGVDLQRFDPEKYWHARESVRAKFAFTASALVIGYVGRFAADKGLGTLLKSWSAIREEYSEARLVLCGSFDYSDALDDACIRQIADDDRIRTITARAMDMPSVYSALDVCVLPSLREGLPNVLLEASAMRVACVASRIAGCLDATNDGKTAILFSPGDANDLTTSLRTILNDSGLRNALARAAHEFVVENFAEDRVSTALSDEYSKLLASHRGLGLTEAN
jgi:glycosyltransferase involved in cell wall biosynthesis